MVLCVGLLVIGCLYLAACCPRLRDGLVLGASSLTQTQICIRIFDALVYFPAFQRKDNPISFFCDEEMWNLLLSFSPKLSSVPERWLLFRLRL